MLTFHETNASHSRLGAVLSQETYNGVRPIEYASQGLKPTECSMANYSFMKLQILVLKWAMTEKFREYLLGHRCMIFTDNTLIYLNSAKLCAMEHCWPAHLALSTSAITMLMHSLASLHLALVWQKCLSCTAVPTECSSISCSRVSNSICGDCPAISFSV